MFIFPVNLVSLRNFFSGYFSSHMFETRNDYNFFNYYKPSFGEWLAMREGLRYAPSTGWVECILSKIDNDDTSAGVTYFFEVFDEYLRDVVRKDHC